MTKSSQFHLFPSKNMNEYYVVMVFVSSILTLQLKYKIMYETLEYWKQYKQEKDLQNKIAQEFELFNECGFQYKEKAKQEMDKFINKLVKKNGTTKY